MKAILQSHRILLREFNPALDAKHAYDLNSDPDVIRFTGDPPFESEKAAREFLENYPDYKTNGYGRWAMELKENGAFLGWCGLKLHSDGLVDLGYRLPKKHWGNGYATEAALACIAFGFEHLALDQIVGRTAHDNKASVKVLLKCGMKFWKDDPCNGIENASTYRIFKKDFGSADKELYSLHG